MTNLVMMIIIVILGQKREVRHVRNHEEAYRFTDPDTLLADFWRDVEDWRR